MRNRPCHIRIFGEIKGSSIAALFPAIAEIVYGGSEYLRVHSTTVYRLLKQGKLAAFEVGSDWRFDAQAIDRWLRGQESDGGIEEN